MGHIDNIVLLSPINHKLTRENVVACDMLWLAGNSKILLPPFHTRVSVAWEKDPQSSFRYGLWHPKYVGTYICKYKQVNGPKGLGFDIKLWCVYIYI